jgi:hypothetical protein
MIMMAKIITAGCTNAQAFFEKIGNIDTGVKRAQTPFLVFLEGEHTIHVQIVDTIERLLLFPDRTPVMVHWQSNGQSDFFQFTVGDYRDYVEKKSWEALWNR